MPVVYRIFSTAQRSRFIRDLERAPVGYTVEVRRKQRSTEQNSRMWAMLTELSKQLLWHGQKLTPEDWKLVAMSGLNQELRVVPNMAGNGMVQLGLSSSKLSVSEMIQLMDLIEAFGAQHGVKFKQIEEAEA